MRRAKLGLCKHVLDNKISKEYRERIAENKMIHELVPPRNHRSLMAEQAIQTWKAHMISNLNGVDENFPISCWCQIVSQMELTLNLLRQSNIVPAISVYAHVHGENDYMRNPFAPIGCRVEVHVKTDNTTEGRGKCIANWGSALARQWNITGATRSTSQEPGQLESAIRFTSNTSTSPTQQYHPNHTL